MTNNLSLYSTGVLIKVIVKSTLFAIVSTMIALLFQMTALTKMLYNKEAGPRKNACFAFSCLANSKEGHDRFACF